MWWQTNLYYVSIILLYFYLILFCLLYIKPSLLIKAQIRLTLWAEVFEVIIISLSLFLIIELYPFLFNRSWIKLIEERMKFKEIYNCKLILLKKKKKFVLVVSFFLWLKACLWLCLKNRTFKSKKHWVLNVFLCPSNTIPNKTFVNILIIGLPTLSLYIKWFDQTCVLQGAACVVPLAINCKSMLFELLIN